MKQIWIMKNGTPDVLNVKEDQDPSPMKDEVRIDVHFSGINFADLLARMGMYPGAPKKPCVVGYEVSGIVDQVGGQIEKDFIGKRVVAITRFGGYSSKVCVPINRILELQDHVPLEDGAAMPIIYLTSYLMLTNMANLKVGETVLIHGIGGGVGTAAFQIATILGAKSIGTASQWKHSELRKMGVEHLIDYTNEDFVERTIEITGGKGVNLVLDPVGGKNLEKSYRCLRSFGKVIVYGSSSAAPGNRRNLFQGLRSLLSAKRFHPVKLMNDNRGILGCHVGRLWKEEETLRNALEELLGWLAEGKIRPKIDKIFSFEDAPAAHYYMHNHRNLGKVLLSPKL